VMRIAKTLPTAADVLLIYAAALAIPAASALLVLVGWLG
jgi:hypothetical protein